jgi:hypothetical protein
LSQRKREKIILPEGIEGRARDQLLPFPPSVAMHARDSHPAAVKRYFEHFLQRGIGMSRSQAAAFVAKGLPGIQDTEMDDRETEGWKALANLAAVLKETTR